MSLVNIFCGAKFLKDNLFIIHPMCVAWACLDTDVVELVTLVMLQPPGEADGHHGQLLLPPQAGAQLELLTLVVTGASLPSTRASVAAVSCRELDL